MISGLAMLLICQLLGELLSTFLSLPIPGPVIGMIVLFCGLFLFDASPNAPNSPDKPDRHPRIHLQGLETAAHGLLQHLALLFVPAGVGIIAYVGLIQQEGWAIIVTLITSTALTLAVTGGVMQRLTNQAHPSPKKEESLR